MGLCTIFFMARKASGGGQQCQPNGLTFLVFNNYGIFFCCRINTFRASWFVKWRVKQELLFPASTDLGNFVAEVVKLMVANGKNLFQKPALQQHKMNWMNTHWTATKEALVFISWWVQNDFPNPIRFWESMLFYLDYFRLDVGEPSIRVPHLEYHLLSQFFLYYKWRTLL